MGAVLAAILLGVAGVLALVRPQPGLGDAPMVVDLASGALYVRVDDTVHPVFNLVSARLIAGPDSAGPRAVTSSAIERARRGPPLGIPGAPATLGPALPDGQTWSLCDDATGTTLLVGVDPPPAARVEPQQPLAVRSEAGATFVLLRGHRLAVSSASVETAAPRQLSGLLLDAVPEARAGEAATLPAAATLAAALTLCVYWRADDPAALTVTAGVGLPASVTPTTLAQADGPGPALDAVYLPPGHSAYVRAAGVSGRVAGAGYLISETGVRFTIGDDAAARSLGLPATPSAVAWPMLAGLPAGALLSRQQALLARDVVLTMPAR